MARYTVGEYIYKFGTEGVNVAILGFRKLDKEASDFLNSNKSLVGISKQLGLEIGSLSRIMGQTLGKQYSAIIKDQKIFFKDVKYLANVNNELKQIEARMQRVSGSKEWKVMPGSMTLSSIGESKVAKALPSKAMKGNFMDRFMADDDIDIAGLIRRAAVTIPVWGALRAGIDSVTSIIPSAIDRFRELDEAVSKMKVLTDGVEAVEDFRGKSIKLLDEVSRETGQSIKEIQEIFTSFSSTGMSFDEAVAATRVFTKGAIATNSEAKELAKIAAGMMNTMGKTLSSYNSTNQADKWMEMMAIFIRTFKINAGEMNDFTEALKMAGAAANTSGMSISELMANVGVLQTAMVRAGMGGTALKSAIDAITSGAKRDVIEDLLGGQLTLEERNNAFLVLIKLMEKIRSIGTSDLSKAQKYISELFNDRASRFAKVLFTNMDQLKRTMGDINKEVSGGPSQWVETNEKEFEIRQQSLSIAGARLANIAKSINSQVIGQLFGSGDMWLGFVNSFVDGMDKIAGSEDNIKNLTRAIQGLGIAIVFVTGSSILKGLSSLSLALTGLIANPIGLSIMLIAGSFVYLMNSIDGVVKASKGLKRELLDSVKNTFFSSFAVKGPVDYSKVKPEVDLGRIDVTAGGVEGVEVKEEARKKSLELLKIERDYEIALSERLKVYGADKIQLLKKQHEIINRMNVDELSGNKLIEEQLKQRLAIRKLEIEEQVRYAQSVQSMFTDVFKKHMTEGDYSTMATQLGDRMAQSFRDNVAENLSQLVMSFGPGDLLSQVFSGMSQATREITDPIILGHKNGANVVYESIVNAYRSTFGSGSSDFDASSVASFGGGASSFSAPSATTIATMTPTGNIISAPSAGGSANAKSGGTNLAKSGMARKMQTAAGVGSAALIGASGIQQMSGGGAKNIVGGLGSVAMGVGTGIGALGATGGLAVLGVAGLAIGAALMVASMFMKGPKSKSEQVQTQEVKVGSKIDISNKKLELINRNLIALKNTMETYALSNSAYFSEKSNIDQQFALEGRRSY